MSRSISNFQPLDLMISSRCRDMIMFEGKQCPMGELRVKMKEKLEKVTLGGKKVFKVWIHEHESTAGGRGTTWDQCIESSRDSEVFVVLYNGHAGWLGSDDDKGSRDGVGICHAEFSAAYNAAPSKVRSIQFTANIADRTGPNAAFQDEFQKLKIPGEQVATGDAALEACEALAASIVLELARAGLGALSQGKFYAGEALDWTRLNFEKRREKMRAAAAELLSGKRDAKDEKAVLRKVAGKLTGFVCDAIPGSMSTAAAREPVGQPFLRDHELCASWPRDAGGPVHVIACQKTVSESQAVKQLGFPDATVVPGPFGVYVADDVQKIQMVFLANCRDRTTTMGQVQRFVQWLEESNEAPLLRDRARARRELSNLIHKLNTEPRHL